MTFFIKNNHWREHLWKTIFHSPWTTQLDCFPVKKLVMHMYCWFPNRSTCTSVRPPFFNRHNMQTWKEYLFVYTPRLRNILLHYYATPGGVHDWNKCSCLHIWVVEYGTCRNKNVTTVFMLKFTIGVLLSSMHNLLGRWFQVIWADLFQSNQWGI